MKNKMNKTNVELMIGAVLMDFEFYERPLKY